MAFNILAGTQYVQQQGEEGRQRGQGQFAAKLLGEAYNSTGAARQDALGRLAGRQPQVAMAADQQFRQQDAQMTEDAFKRLQTHAQFLQKIPAEQRPQAWAQLQPRIAQELPEYAQYLPSQWDEAAVMPVVEQLASMGGDDSQLPSSVREAQAFRADPSLLETRRQMYGSYSYGEVPMPDGTVAQRRANSRTGKMELVLANGDVIPLAGETDTGGGMLGQPAPAPAAAPPPRQPPTRTYEFGPPVPGEEADLAANLPEQEQQLAGRLMEAGMTFTVQNGRVVPSGAAPKPGWGPNGAPPTQQPPTQQPAVNRPLPSINDIGGGPLPPMRGSGRGGMGFGMTSADQAAAKANEAAQIEAAKRGVGLDYAAPEADAAADAARKKKEAESLAERNANSDKKASQAIETLSTLEDVISILPNATGSRLGSLRDAALAVGGMSTEGAQAASQLRLLSAKLIANVPRFEGPQSNIDVQFYREAAGDLANENLPVDTRLAAAKKMKEIAERYSQGGTQAAPEDDEDALIGKYL